MATSLHMMIYTKEMTDTYLLLHLFILGVGKNYVAEVKKMIFAFALACNRPTLNERTQK